MKFEYETNSGTKGRVEADTEQLAVVMLSEQFGPEGATLIEGTAQAAAPAATAPTAAPGTAAAVAPTATAAAPGTQAPAAAAPADPHGWSRAFATASAR